MASTHDHSDRADATPAAPTSRRNLLRLAGAAATGVVASTLLANRASADNGLTIATAGATTSDEFTKVTFNGASSAGHLFMFRSDASAADTASGARAVLTGASTLNSHNGVVGVHSGSGGGVFGLSDSGTGVFCVSSQGDALKVNVGTGDANHISFGSAIGAGTPYLRTTKFSDAHTLSVFQDKALWYCVGAGTPGTWRKLVDSTTAGAFHAIATARVYDSRKTMTPMANGIIANAQNRVIDVSDKRNPSTGAVTLADVVPDHASAVAYNLTIVNTVGTNGFLGVEPGDATLLGGSAINWSAAGLTLANASVAKLDGSRQLKVFCGGSSTSCHFIIDVVGYYL